MNQYPREEPEEVEGAWPNIWKNNKWWIDPPVIFISNPSPANSILREYFEQRKVGSIHIHDEYLVEGELDTWNETIKKLHKIDFSAIEARMSTLISPHLLEIQRLNEERIAREKNALAELMSLYGEDFSDRVRKASESLNMSVMELSICLRNSNR